MHTQAPTYRYIYIYTCMHIHTYKNNTHTHTHTHIYIFFYLTPDFRFVSVSQSVWNAYKRDHDCNQAAI